MRTILIVGIEVLMMNFTLQHKDPNSRARTGLITTDHGEIRTPIFMPGGRWEV